MAGESLHSMKIPVPRRRRFQFSLRTFLVLVTIGTLWLGRQVERARSQREVITELRGQGQVYHEHWLDARGGWDTRLPAPGPSWLRRLVGDEYFVRPHYVVVDAAGPILGRLREIDSIKSITIADGGPITTEHVRAVAEIKSLTSVHFGQMVQFEPLLSFDGRSLDRLADLPRLRSLDLQALTIRDGDLARLARIKRLEYVQIYRGRVTDRGVRHLATLPRLRTLKLWDLRLTDAGMVVLSPLTTLRSLWLVNVGLSDAGLDHLLELGNLESLSVSENGVTDAGLAKLVSLKGLRELHLASTRVTSDGLALLRGLPDLETLGLEGTHITDDGLMQLAKLKNLKHLCLPQAVAGKPKAAKLKKMLPACNVRFY